MKKKRGKGKEKLFTVAQIAMLIGVGVVMGCVLVFFSDPPFQGGLQETSGEVKTNEDAPVLLYSKNIAECRALCYKPPEKPKPVVAQPVANRATSQVGFTRLADLPKKIKNPNAIRISLREAPPILAKVKMVNGRPTCAKKNDKGSKSDKYDHVHVDQECCLDPDEIPNPRCLYR